MIVQESDLLLAALDRRLQVDRILAIDPLMAGARSTDAPRQPAAPSAASSAASSTTAAATSSATSSSKSLASARTASSPTTSAAQRGGAATSPGPGIRPSGNPSSTAAIAAWLPLGRTVAARVVDVPRANQVVAEIGSLRIEMDWPANDSTTPRTGDDIRLRVLAHEPMLLFQSASADEAEGGRAAAPTDAPSPWSRDTLRLLGAAAATTAEPATTTANAPRRSGPVVFDVPMLGIEYELIQARTTPDTRPSARTAASSADGAERWSIDATAPDPTPATSPATRPANVAADAARSIGFEHDDVARLPATSARGTTDPIAIDDVIVARSTAVVDGIAAPLIPRAPDDPTQPPAGFVPLVLQGPAWPGQPMELIVRRQREDEQFENPVLDHWCGDVLIDLPRLGRVAGHLVFSMHGLRIRLEGDDEAAVDAMTAAAAELANALADADLRISALSVGRPAADATRPDPSRSASTTFTGPRDA